MAPDIALAASAREWPDRLHRHLLDHGGGRVVTRVMGPEQAVEASFEVLLIDDICSFLTPRLVSVVKRSGSEVIGVFSPSDGSDAKRRLLECGISDVIESDATPEEFIDKVLAALGNRERTDVDDTPPRSAGRLVGVTGASDGVGITEVAVGLAQGIGREVSVALIDLDPLWPSVAQRLDLSPHPNVRTALDLALHNPGDLERAVHHLGSIQVVGGVADHGSASPLSHSDVGVVLDGVGRLADVLVADLGPVHRAVRGAFHIFDVVVVVGSGDPVGISRLARCVQALEGAVDDSTMVVVANKAPRRRFYEGEIRSELSAAFPGLPVLVLPFDFRLAEATWEGQPLSRGPFARSVGRMAVLIAEGASR